MHPKRLLGKTLLLCLVGSALLGLPALGPVATASSKPFLAKPTNPFYPVIEAFGEGSVEVGVTVRGCKIEPLTNCSGSSLGGAELAQALLAGADLRNLRAPGATLGGATVSFARMQKADLRGIGAPALITSFTQLGGAKLANADLTLGALAEMHARDADLRGANLFSADLTGADLRGAGLRGANMAGALAAGTDLRGADLRDVFLSSTDLHKARLAGANLTGASFCNTIMPSGKVRNTRKTCPLHLPKAHGPTIPIPPEAPVYTVLRAAGSTPKPPGEKVRGCVIAPSAVCNGGDLRGASLHAAFLSYARYPRADFREASLTLGNVSFADFTAADFSHAVLAGAAAVKSTMVGANLLQANLTLADFVAADLSRAILSGADGRSSNFTAASLRSADLSGADMSDVVFIRADLRRAKLAGTDLSEAILTGAQVSPGFADEATLCNTSMPNGHIANPQKECG